MILRFVNSSTCSNTVVYWLIAAATIILSEQKGTATKQGWLLYERWPLNLCRVLRSVIYTVLMFQMYQVTYIK